VVVLMAFDEVGRITLMTMPLIILAMVAGWYAVRTRIDTSVMEHIN